MCRGAQRPHVNVEFVGKDVKWHSITQWPLRLQCPGSTEDSLRRGPPAGIPRAERFERDAKGCRAIRLGQTELRSIALRAEGG